MKTLIELYDERPLENVLSVDVFRPETVIYICPDYIAADKSRLKILQRFFSGRGIYSKPVFFSTDIYSTGAIQKSFRDIISHYPDCAIDITGGTDDILFTAGMICAENPSLPVFTYSRKRNCFFNIKNAEFAESLACPLRYSVEDFFVMVGGSMRSGRFDNSLLKNYLPYIEPFFRVYLKNRNQWVDFISYMQKVTASDPGGAVKLNIKAPYQVNARQGHRISANEQILNSLKEIGFISQLQISDEREISFRFKDAQVRAWLRDVGSVLELMTYKACLDTDKYYDVITSAVVDWETQRNHDAVSNELDVMATCGVTPVFISCKTCDVKTEALNELAILRDRFGGQIARAAIVTAERGNSRMRNRAAKLGISVIDLDDLEEGRLESELKAIAEDIHNQNN